MITSRRFGDSASIYTVRLDDPSAVYLTKEHFAIHGDGIGDDTATIQQAIYEAQEKCRFGIVFIPEGTYRISSTIYLGKGMRLIGYGSKRPVILLGENTQGYQEEPQDDKGKAKYMFWFADRAPLPGETVKDAGAGTFYSAISNINIQIAPGNPAAIALRTHFAQHSFISYVDIDIGEGKAGIFDVGNEIEHVHFFGGKYGILTTKPSAGWPFMMVDTYFSGQRDAAIRTRQAGLTIVRMEAANVPTVIDVEEGYYEKLYMEDCRFDQVSGSALRISNERSPLNQINLHQIICRQVPELALFIESGKSIAGVADLYEVTQFTHGSQMDDVNQRAEVRTTLKLSPIAEARPPISDIPVLPSADIWVNLQHLGAVPDEHTDNTDIIRAAIEAHRVIYVPSGWYRISDTITLKPDTILIGINPISTQFILPDNSPAFAGFGSPKPLLEAPKGGSCVVSGIALDTGGRNPRAVGCKWMAGASSYMNDVKIIGGHGSMSTDGTFVKLYNEGQSADADPNRKWDSQYWSLWITEGGGGVFKDIWTASPFDAAGWFISDTTTPGRIYASSIEHHVRNEVVLKNVENWRFYAYQFEEEVAEGTYCLPLEMVNCRNIMFANLYFFRVIWHTKPYPYAIKAWNCDQIEMLNVHNYSQIKYTLDNTLLDVGSGIEVRERELARLNFSSIRKAAVEVSGSMTKLAGGFEFGDGICTDQAGNVYFADARLKRIYAWNSVREELTLVCALPFKPLSLGCDTAGNLLVVVEYLPSKGAMLGDKPEVYDKPADALGTSYGFWYNTGSTIKVYTIDPKHPETSIQILEPVSIASVPRIERSLHPTNRWRDSSDYLQEVIRPTTECYVAPDGVTIIPCYYDLMRTNALQAAVPGENFYGIDEYNKRTYRFEVDEKGFLRSPQLFAERGEVGTAVDANGLVYAADGQILLYDAAGSYAGEINVPERPGAIIITEDNVLYAVARTSLYRLFIEF